MLFDWKLSPQLPLLCYLPILLCWHTIQSQVLQYIHMVQTSSQLPLMILLLMDHMTD